MSPHRHGRVAFEGVWKSFHKGERHDSLRDLIPSVVGTIVGRRPDSDEDLTFWALEDLSFSVEPGEVLGVIGPNGSGKSTLLKLLTGILHPDKGTVRVRGRVGSLIEVAAGFHPDLTGRENVFLQGAVLGMSQAEVQAKFEDIVEFAEVGDFVDTPVKRYSSGMNARLGFAIAAHLDPDVLLIDEVLSVGDRAFQRKADDHIAGLVDRGIPIVLVSHQLERVAKLCTRVIFLHEGQVFKEGTAAECIASYVDSEHLKREDGIPLTQVRLHSLSTPVNPTPSGERIKVHLRGEVLGDVEPGLVAVGVGLRELPSEAVLFWTHNELCGQELPEHGAFDLEVDLHLPLGAGVYRLQSFVFDLERGIDVDRGPNVVLEIEGASHVRGKVNADPSMKLLRP